MHCTRPGANAREGTNPPSLFHAARHPPLVNRSPVESVRARPKAHHRNGAPLHQPVYGRGASSSRSTRLRKRQTSTDHHADRNARCWRHYGANPQNSRVFLSFGVFSMHTPTVEPFWIIVSVIFTKKTHRSGRSRAARVPDPACSFWVKGGYPNLIAIAGREAELERSKTGLRGVDLH
jgi:hypothetical protein